MNKKNLKRKQRRIRARIAQSQGINQSYSEYSQAGYTQQYGFPTTLQSVQSNAAHASTGQPGMYSNSGGLPSVPQHHHQPGMTGLSPSARSSVVQPSQQMNRAHLSLPTFYGRNNAPQAVPNMIQTVPPVVNGAAAQQAAQYGCDVEMVQSHGLHLVGFILLTPQMYFYGRNNAPQAVPNMIQTVPPVVNGAEAQQDAQYGYDVEMVQSHGLHPMGPILLTPQMYSQQTYNQTPFSMISAGQLYPCNNWNNFNNPPPLSANGLYSPYEMSSYSMNPQLPPHNSEGQLQAKKHIPIIDPKTRKNILDGVNNETSAQKEDNQDAVESSSAVYLEFATKVAMAFFCPKKKDDPSLQQSAVEDSVATTSVQLDNRDRIDSNINNIVGEKYIDSENALLVSETLRYYNKDDDLNNIDSYESKCIPSIESEVDNQDWTNSEDNKEEVSLMNEERKITDLSQDDFNLQKCQVIRDILSTNKDTLDKSTRVLQPNMLTEEKQQETIETVDTVNNYAEVQEKSRPEGKKNKMKKKKALNKKKRGK